LHRNCRVLKKPGQYQDAIILATTGNNSAYTYTDKRYGKLGRAPGQSCFGFTGNVVNDKLYNDFPRVVRTLQKKGEQHILRLQRAGRSNPYKYSMVMDSDTVSEWRSVLRLVEYGVANPDYGLFQPSLNIDDEQPGSTWYMWSESLRQASNSNLPLAFFRIFGRHGFYGKGLIDHDKMMSCVIGYCPEPNADGTYEALEALPVDIMSHDTFEAKLLRPAFVAQVALREEPARNAISAFPQSTRWMTGEVRNASYAPGLFKNFIVFAQRLYGVSYGNPPSIPFMRQFDIPASASTKYLSHVTFRVMHAGPVIMTLILLRNYCSAIGLLHFRNSFLATYLTVFTAASLFVIPKGLLFLDTIPSLRLCSKRNHDDSETGYVYEPAQSSPHFVPSQRRRCSCIGVVRIAQKLILSVVEAVLSVLVFGPECFIGMRRMMLAYWAQISGHVMWTPQAQVDQEVEEEVSGGVCQRFKYVMRKTWGVPAAGLVVAISSGLLGIHDPLTVTLWASWLLHPVLTTWGCSEASSTRFWLVRWVKEIRDEKNGSAKSD